MNMFKKLSCCPSCWMQKHSERKSILPLLLDCDLLTVILSMITGCLLMRDVTLETAMLGNFGRILNAISNFFHRDFRHTWRYNIKNRLNFAWFKVKLNVFYHGSLRTLYIDFKLSDSISLWVSLMYTRFRRFQTWRPVKSSKGKVKLWKFMLKKNYICI